jgi:4-diphosphocytidyl-2-C-methyl-D-erythritol kinase
MLRIGGREADQSWDDIKSPHHVADWMLTGGRGWPFDENAIFVAAMIIRACDEKLEIATPAKVNFFLELCSRRPDGFHEVENVMATVSIYDQIRFVPRSDSQINLTINTTGVGNGPRETDVIPTNQDNLINQSISLLRTTAQETLGPEFCSKGMDIHLSKNIPSAAGLGGASSNAAATLIAANRIWGLNWTLSQLSSIAAKLGSDIPFFLTGGTAICRGRGEQIQPIHVPAGLALVIAKPPVSVSTARVFSGCSVPSSPENSSDLIQGVRRGQAQNIGRAMFNRLQRFAEPLTRQIATLRNEFNRLCCLGHQMSGSGSSYFGIFANAHVARRASCRLSARLPDVRIFCVQTLGAIHELRVS